MVVRSTDVMILIGAGASAEAGIPVSSTMIGEVQKNLATHDDWKPHRSLYNHVKSAVYYSYGLKGLFNDGDPVSVVPFNIEVLANTLYELERNEDHPLYPFIASWNSRFVSLAGENFSNVIRLRRLILSALKKWMCPEDISASDYYRGLVELQRALNFPLHVFSLNYDMCVERLSGQGIRVETGFEDFGPAYPWDWERFSDSMTGGNVPPEIFLYKLHGSINWKRTAETQELFTVEQIQSIEDHEMEVIFGRDFKLEAADPFLFFAYQLRQYTLRSRLIVAIGYGFGDLHINKLLSQSIREDETRQLVVVQRCSVDNLESKAAEVADRLRLVGPKRSQVVICHGSAKEFLTRSDLSEYLTAMIPEVEQVPF